MNDPILITGCARSGTSLVAGIINLCGAFGGNMSGANRNNKKGMFENAKIRNEILKPYLTTCGADRLGQYPLPDIKNLIPLSDLREKIENIMQEQGYNGGAWMYKGAKMCLVWPIFKAAFPGAKWVIVRRRKDDIVSSCLHTSFMKAFSTIEARRAIGVKTVAEGWRWWVDQHLTRFDEMLGADLNIQFVWPEKMIDKKNYDEMQFVIEWLGLNWSNEIYNFVTPALWSTKREYYYG